MKRYFLLSIFLFIFSCSGIQMLNHQDLYSPEFMKQIESAQLVYKDGDRNEAIKKLKLIQDEFITPDERAKKYNLLGVYYFSVGNIELATESFQVANQLVNADYRLASQIKLNLASSFFKVNDVENTYSTLTQIDSDYLGDKDKAKYHKLVFSTANQLGKTQEVVKSLLYLGKGLASFRAVDDFKFVSVLVDNFKKLSDSERIYLLEKNYRENSVVVAYLGRQEVLSRFYKGDRDGALNVVEWLESKFSEMEEVKTFVVDYKYRVENFSKINSGAIGVVVPLTGSRARFGVSALAGVKTALKEKSGTEESYRIHVKDNENNPLLAKKAVQELVMKHNVSVIIGGMSPEIAIQEYTEAKKYGVLYISISTVNVPRSQKNHLLFEIPGSIESQVKSVTKKEFLDKFGKRVAIVYPEDESGQKYVNELWAKHNQSEIELVNIAKYERGQKDFRNVIQKILGLEFPRQRNEEYLVMKEIKDLEKGSFRIINVLPPVIDFDWVFLPTYPSEAIQIIPTFNYFDARRLKFIGGPSWISKKLKQQEGTFGVKLHMVGNDSKLISKEFKTNYYEFNKKIPNIVDILGYQSMETALLVLNKQNFSKREELESRVLDLKSFEINSVNWELKEGLWIKDMNLLKFGRVGVEPVSLEEAKS